MVKLIYDSKLSFGWNVQTDVFSQENSSFSPLKSPMGVNQTTPSNPVSISRAMCFQYPDHPLKHGRPGLQDPPWRLSHRLASLTMSDQIPPVRHLRNRKPPCDTCRDVATSFLERVVMKGDNGKSCLWKLESGDVYEPEGCVLWWALLSVPASLSAIRTATTDNSRLLVFVDVFL